MDSKKPKDMAKECSDLNEQRNNYNPEDHLVLWHDDVIYPLNEAFRVAMRERGVEVEEENTWLQGIDKYR